jgi:hypothetical protein
MGLSLLCLGAGSAFAADNTEGIEYFESHVRPVLVDHCYSCHSSEATRVRGELLLDSKAGWEKGGTSGKPALIPGDVEASPLVVAIRHGNPDLAMPPKAKLSDEQIAVLEHWVRLGAPDPRIDGQVLADPAELARSHWAFQPVQDPPLPPVKDTSWIQNGVDRFILSRLEAEGVAPSPPADPRTLLRRASLLLTGLLPTREELDVIAAEPSPEAFAREVDRLLASPRYGERWGRHWLDVARYADTKGYVFEEERRYPYAYTYRDYVIRSFNEDKPYDQFLIEQIAADQMELDPQDRTPLAGLGFLTLGRRFLNNPHDIIDDRIDVLTRGTMALTVSCARCHDHKYDPIPTADYYSLYGVFASSEEPAEKPLLGSIPDPVRHAEFEAERQRRTRERDEFVQTKENEHREKLRRSVGDYLLAAHETQGKSDADREELARSRKLSPEVVQRWQKALEEWPGEPPGLLAIWRAYAALPSEDFEAEAARLTRDIASTTEHPYHPVITAAFATNAPTSLRAVADRYNEAIGNSEDPSLQGLTSAEDSPIQLAGRQLHRLFDVPEAQRMRALQRSVEELEATHPGAPPRAMALIDKDKAVEPVVFQRGNPGNRGETVPRRFLEILSGEDRQPFAQGSGRLEMARAIASPDNPLTARVAVNRIWQGHFGNGLVRTPADFGLRSEPPSHPELLDWLAVQFVREGWSMKRLHRLLVLSATWQQTSDLRPDLGERDPENRLVARQTRRRLDFEAMRDQLLAASGQLDLTMGGHSVEIANEPYTPRRAVYGIIERQNLPGLFRTFDFASPDTTTSQRFQTTVPQQALFFLNSGFVQDQARSLVTRPEIQEIEDPRERIQRLYERVLQRAPQTYELDLAEAFISQRSAADTLPKRDPLWQYGWGAFDAEEYRVTRFEALPHFTGKAWQGGDQLPDARLGWLLLNAEGGHPGSLKHGPVIRRWTAPQEAVVRIRGRLEHPADAGDGVQAYLISDRHGLLGQWSARNGRTATRVDAVHVLPGDTLDFVVACGADENSDSFSWAPKVEVSEGTGGLTAVWDARADFGGPTEPMVPLNAWEQYAQVLLMTNEAAFVD